MSLVTIVDCETTGTDPIKDKVIEVGAILYSLEFAAPIQSASTLFWCTQNPAQEINWIAPELTQCFPSLDVYDPLLAMDLVAKMMKISTAILAHSAEFDKGFLARVDGDPGFGKPWICTMKHVEWPKKCSSKSLAAIALAHGVGIVSVHRAMSDCDTIARLLTRVHEMGVDLEQLIARAMRPRVLVRAFVNYDERQLAKDAGFEWDGQSKRWTAEVVDEDRYLLPFETERI